MNQFQCTHSVFALALVYEAIGIAHDILDRIAVSTDLETAEQIARRLAHDLLQLGGGLLDPVDRVLDQKTVMRTADQVQTGLRARSRGA